jgi:CBS domain containing-hemolysin-like protein
MAGAVVRGMGVHPAQKRENGQAEDDLRIMYAASGASNGDALHGSQAELLDNVLEFGRRVARQIMVHRTELLALDIDDPLDQNVRTAQQGGHTRYPVYEGDLDRIKGFVHTKDLFALYQEDPQGEIRDIIREVLVAPEGIGIALLLRQLQRKRQQMAVLVDEYGGTAGIITVSDMLEELVGELPDEFEPDEDEWIIPLGERVWSVDGRLPLADLEDALERELSCEEACDTVGGYAYWAFGRIPAVGDSAETDDVNLRILAMDGRRVSRIEVAVKLLDEDDDEADEVVLDVERR